VPEYRAYTVGYDGHFIGYEPLVCPDDANAIERANRLVDNVRWALFNIAHAIRVVCCYAIGGRVRFCK
jgi:hypothetical protein